MAMKLILNNIVYNTDVCETISVRDVDASRHEFLLCAPNGDLLLATSSTGSPAGRPPHCGDVVAMPSGEMGTVHGYGNGKVLVRTKDGSDVHMDAAECHACHPPFHKVRRWIAGEPADGMSVDSANTEARLVGLGLVKRAVK